MNYFVSLQAEMLLPTKFVTKTLSVRISLMVVSAIATLLTVALFVMFYFSRKAVKEEVQQTAEQTLESTMRQVDNVLLSVEQSAGNIYWEMVQHLGEPGRMDFYCQKIVETNAYVADCSFLQSPDQERYRKPMELGRPMWVDPHKDKRHDDKVATTFCLPVYSMEGHPIGVVAVDVSLALLSRIVLDAKPSPNSYIILLGSDGSYIVHPDSDKLLHKTVFDLPRHTAPEMLEAGKAMVGGETGYKHFRLNGVDSYVFYKPFRRSVVPGRSQEESGWSIGLVYPEDDIFGDYHRLSYIVFIIVVAGLILLWVGCKSITHRMLLPLRMLTKSAQRIAEGHYNTPIPDSRQHDEVGRLQDHFQQMQKALSAHVGELERLTRELQQRGEVLAKTYEQAKEADRVKTAFLHHMTDQMMAPVGAIMTGVGTLCEQCQDMDQQQAGQLVDEIDRQAKVVTGLLNKLLDVAQQEVENSR